MYRYEVINLNTNELFKTADIIDATNEVDLVKHDIVEQGFKNGKVVFKVIDENDNDRLVEIHRLDDGKWTTLTIDYGYSADSSVFLIFGGYVEYDYYFDNDLDDYYNERDVEELLMVCKTRKVAEKKLDLLSRGELKVGKAYSSFRIEEWDVKID